MAQLHKIDRHTNVVGVSSAQSRAKRSRFVLGFAALGAITFWFPDVLIHLNAGRNLSSQQGWAITLVCPAAFLFAYVAARRLALRLEFNWPGTTMLLGVWLTGGLFMTAAAMASGSEFVGGTGLWRLVVIALSVIPIVTYVLASYDGSLFALLAVTVGGLLVCGFRSSCMLWNSAGTQSTPAVNNSDSHHDGKAA
jgi:hypothetical protein